MHPRKLLVDAEALIRCHEQCARNCGVLTDCRDKSECVSCCDTYCNSEYGGPSSDACKTACVKSCNLKGGAYEIIDIIYYTPGIIAALIIAINGLIFLTSQDFGARENAKCNILYVILALILIVVAGILVDLLISVLSLL